jgi:aspartyl-tRNA(Asn)/glutamyl-tRNA(Gln) amidotransferase subunit A
MSRTGETRERVTRALEQAEARSGLGAFWALDRDGALAAADDVDAAAPLAGTPVAIKDLFDMRGLPTTAGVPGPTEPAGEDADLVARLRLAGAIPLGKTAMDPLGCTTGGQAPGFPPCVNPLDAELSPGGSSAGSAVAVAAGIVALALGTDTAGSARIPAAYCGIVGFKPAHDGLPRDGSVRVMPTFDTAGLLGDSVDRCVSAYAALGGDLPAAPEPPPAVALLTDLVDGSDPAVAGICREIAEAIGAHEARLDWKPDGFGAALARDLADNWAERVEREPDRFTDVIRDTIAFGSGVDPTQRDWIIDGFRAASARLAGRLGVVLCPTVPVPAPRREDETVKVSTSFTRIFNALDWPALSIPAGRHGGAPIAVQVAAPPDRLAELVAVAGSIEGLARPEAR